MTTFETQSSSHSLGRLPVIPVAEDGRFTGSNLPQAQIQSGADAGAPGFDAGASDGFQRGGEAEESAGERDAEKDRKKSPGKLAPWTYEVKPGPWPRPQSDSSDEDLLPIPLPPWESSPPPLPKVLPPPPFTDGTNTNLLQQLQEQEKAQYKSQKDYGGESQEDLKIYSADAGGR